MDKNKFKNPSSIRIKDDLKQQLLRVAFIEKRSFGNLVNKILQEYLEKNKDNFEYKDWIEPNDPILGGGSYCWSVSPKKKA